MSSADAVAEFIDSYCKNVHENLQSRWAAYTPDLKSSFGSDALAGLLARQAALAIEFARNPGVWNGNIAPIILRTMTDAHISIAWILERPRERGKEFVLYGLGQEKLQLEQLRSEAEDMPEEAQEEGLQDMIRAREAWLESQIAHWALDVNLGSWSGKSTRQMATECGCESLYKFAYTPFSAATHSTWGHVGRYNVERCEVALHKGHYLPVVLELDPAPDFLYRSAKYISKTFSLFSEKAPAKSDVVLPAEYFLANFPAEDNRGES